MTRDRCTICGESTPKPTAMCRACEHDYNKNAHNDGSVMEALVWAAKRARWYAERRRPKSYTRTQMLAAFESGVRIGGDSSPRDHDHKEIMKYVRHCARSHVDGLKRET